MRDCFSVISQILILVLIPSIVVAVEYPFSITKAEIPNFDVSPYTRIEVLSVNITIEFIEDPLVKSGLLGKVNENFIIKNSDNITVLVTAYLRTENLIDKSLILPNEARTIKFSFYQNITPFHEPSFEYDIYSSGYFDQISIPNFFVSFRVPENYSISTMSCLNLEKFFGEPLKENSYWIINFYAKDIDILELKWCPIKILLKKSTKDEIGQPPLDKRIIALVILSILVTCLILYLQKKANYDQ